MKKLTKKILFVFGFSCLLFSCSKQPEQIIHNADVAKTIEGSWKLETKSQATMHPDPNEPNYILGILTYNTKTVQTFMPNQEFETVMSQEGVSFDFTEENGEEYGYSKEELIASANGKYIIKGKYSVSDDRLLLENSTVSMNDGADIPYDDFIVQNPSFGANRQVVDWDLKNNKLNFHQKVNGQVMSVSYSKVE